VSWGTTSCLRLGHNSASAENWLICFSLSRVGFLIKGNAVTMSLGPTSGYLQIPTLREDTKAYSCPDRDLHRVGFDFYEPI